MNILYKNYITLFFAALLTLLVTSASAQTTAGQIKGKVVDDQGEPLIGATVIVKGTNIGIATGVDGSFTVRATPTQSLVFTYLGYEDIELLVGKNTNLSVVMRPSKENTLEEVIVVGYGTMAKSDLTGSVASVAGEVFEDGSQMNFADALQGQVAGVEVVSSGGTLGGAVSIRIRGSNSLGSTEPLYIIDGVEFDNSYVDDFAGDGSYQSPLASINPSDIASMEILKDASATAIYGSAASNGVVLITTKSGQAGKPKVTLSASYTVGTVLEQIDMLNYNEYVLIRQEAYENDGSSNMSDERLAVARRGMYKSYNWQDIMTQVSNGFNATASISGGSDDLKYMLSMNAYYTTGLVPTTDLMRVTGRLNLTFKVNNKLQLGSNITMSNVDSNSASTSDSSWASVGVMSAALNTVPNISPETGIGDINTDDYDEDEEISYSDYIGSSSTPWLTLTGVTRESVVFSAMANLYANYTIVPGLSFRVSGSYSLRDTFAGYYRSIISSSTAYSAGGIAQVKKSQSISLSNDYTLSLNKVYNKVHRLNAVVGFQIRQSDSDSFTMEVQDFPHDDYLWYSFSSGVEHEDLSNSYSQDRSLSWFGRFNYTFKNRYLFTFTGRIDGNSRFAPENRYSSYPAGAFAWRISEEPWLKGHKTISNLKWSTSYGITGNKASSALQAIDVVSTTTVTFGNSSNTDTDYIAYLKSNTMTNEELTWETTAQLSSSIELGMFKNRLTMELEYYQKDTQDLLVTATLADHTGYTNSYLNFGSLTNRGVEFSINYTFIRTADLNVSAGFNISRTRTTLQEVQGGLLDTGYWVSYFMEYTTPLYNGYDLGTFSGYVRDGVRQEGEGEVNYKYGNVTIEEGDQKFVDTNGDGILDENDHQIIGYAQSDFSYGLNISATYKGFSARFYFNGTYGNDIFNVTSVNYFVFDEGTSYKRVLERWTPENPSDIYPKVRYSDDRNKMISRQFIEEGTYFKLKTISLGYNLPSNIVRAMKLSSVRVYSSISNPWMITNYSGFNPDVSIGGNNAQKMGHDSTTTPSPFSVSIGLDVQF